MYYCVFNTTQYLDKQNQFSIMTPPEVKIPTKEMESIAIQDTTEISSSIHVETFSVEANPHLKMDIGEWAGAGAGAGEQKPIVGTVTFFNKSAMVWLSWGDVTDDELQEKVNNVHVSGKGIPTMGPMVVAMPRSKYVGFGASSNDESAPCSQLISSSNDEEMMLGWQMASRLTKKVGWPIFVSTSLEHSPQLQSYGGGVNDMEIMANGRQDFSDTSVFHLIALAEKKVGDIILKRKSAMM